MMVFPNDRYESYGLLISFRVALAAKHIIYSQCQTTPVRDAWSIIKEAHDASCGNMAQLPNLLLEDRAHQLMWVIRMDTAQG